MEFFDPDKEDQVDGVIEYVLKDLLLLDVL